MGVAERRAREKEALRHAILDAAGQLIVENGFENLSIRKLAERIEYAPATIYLYFQDKAEILASICQAVVSELAAKLEAIAAAAPDPLTALHQSLRGYIEFGLAHPSKYIVTFVNQPALEAAVNIIRTAIERCVHAEQLPPGNNNLRAQMAWAAIHGLTTAMIGQQQDERHHFTWEPQHQLIESMVTTILNGMQATPIAAHA